jgi:NADH-quinone oxidoreductase subunit L
VTAGITAFYTARMVLLTFSGEYRGSAHPHESPPSMTGPLVFLAAATVGVGFLGSPQLGAVFGDWVFFEHAHESTFVAWIALAGTVVALAGILGGFALYRDRKETDPMRRGLGPVWNVLEHRYYIDDFYMAAIVRPIRDRVSAGVNWFNQNVLDGLVNGAAVVARGFSVLIAWFDRTIIDGFLNGVAGITGETGGLLKYLQSGNVQWYAVVLFVGVIAITIIFVQVA